MNAEDEQRAERREEPKRRVLDFDAIYEAACKRDPSKIELLDWVFNHVGVDPAKIPMDDWPCAGAARLLIEANKDYPGFLALWKATIPNQTQLKLQERAKEDGRATPLLDALEEEIAHRSQRVLAEPPLPKGIVGTGVEQPVSEG